MRCYGCNQVLSADVPYHNVTKEIQTGRSGGSFTFGRSGNNRGRSRRGASYNTGRNYYKNVVVPYCGPCYNQRLVYGFFKVVFAILIILIAIPVIKHIG